MAIDGVKNNFILTDIQKGLSSEVANFKISARKNNKITNESLVLVLQVLKNQIYSIFFFLLLVSAILSYFLHQYIDCLIFIIINLANVLLGFIQEFKASKASQSLMKLIRHNACVVRDGNLISIDSEKVVEGDIIELSPGNILVADVLVRECSDAVVDESVRTGESLPRDIKCEEIIYAGSNMVSGTVKGQVVGDATSNSLIKYANTLSKVHKNNSFTKFVSDISRKILIITCSCLVFVLILSVAISEKYSFSEFTLFSISMLVGVVPESLALIITFMLTKEALSLSKENVLVKRLSALQQMGSIKYLLADKTGTLTENKISIKDVIDIDNINYFSKIVANSQYDRTPMDESFDIAIKNSPELNAEDGLNKTALQNSVEFYPFKNSIGFASYVFNDLDIKVIRGQFNSVFFVCHNLSEPVKRDLNDRCASYEDNGLRVIALAYKKATNSTESYNFSGLLLFEDPLKPDAAHSFKAAQGLDVSVKILTGDSVRVATYIAKKLDQTLDERHVCSVATTNITSLSKYDIEEDKVYAKCTPDEKLLLIDRHLELGSVGFLGEGINDALALKRADVGIVVDNASDIAKQTADIILTESSLNPVIKAIQMSRRVYAHIYTYLLCTLTGNIGTLISLTAVTIFWKDLPMLPIQILLNNLLTDIPLTMLIADNLSRDVYKKPIEHSSLKFMKIIVTFGILSTIFDLVFFYLFKDNDIAYLRTGWLIFSVICELILVLSLRTEKLAWKGPKPSMGISFALLSCTIIVLLLPYIGIFANAFHLVKLSLNQIFVLIGITIIYFFSNEILKLYFPLMSKSPALKS